TGEYMVNLFLVKDNHPQNLLGTTSVRVAEFQPDRMRITSNLEPKPTDGWTSPTDLKAKVNLWNLYGAPAANRKVSGKILLTPQQIQFSKYPEYIFSDPLFDPKKPPKTFTETLKDTKTNDKGEAEFNLNLERFEKATYQLTFFAEGFEAEGGRSVTTQSKTLISPSAYFIGYKKDGDLTFIKQNSVRNLNFIAVNPQLSLEEIKDLKIQLVSLHPVTTLVKKADGTYQYQSIIQSSILNTSAFNVDGKGTNYAIPTQQIGDFALNVLDKNNTILSQLNFSVVGASQSPLAKNAELSIKLNKDEFQANEDIELQITAPYTGSGLITIERDKVYATQWFKTETTNSVQTIHIPADFQGNGYVNVAFIRDWDSPELFVSPLSYSVAPFTVSNQSHHIKIDLETVKVGRPGEPFTINYKTDKPGKIIVFAVDEGILQVARYKTPNPLEFFFRKHALEVLTQQTVDQILPKFIQDRELSAVGGDAGEDLGSHLNPFKRKTDLPVVYWSGIVDADTTSKQLTYQMPDYFNGTIRVMAVAVSTDSVGAQETSAEIRGDFIINPNVPTFVAPGDQFEVSTSVANNIKDSGDHTEITIALEATPGIEILDGGKQTLEIKEGQEQTVRFKLKATSLLGSAKLTFRALTGDKSGAMDATLSVRPASPLFTRIESGSAQGSLKSLDILQTLYPEYRHVDATMSTSPLILVFGL
ncbi:MAG: alpha-2-macroglobulin family protein, partial [bacterium]|nr:alpha-2-macroglobulin family protein [bacterium]